jgi:propionyl-CoA synthetase
MQEMTMDKEAAGRTLHERWRQDPNAFWTEAARSLDWNKAPKQNFDPARGWFPGGVCNACWNAVDRHVMRGHGADPAIIHEPAAGGERRVVPYERLWTELQVLGAILRDRGVAVGDHVVIFMPAVPEAVFGMLACARIGAVHVAVSGGASTDDLAKVIARAKPKVILTASAGFDADRATPYKARLDEALTLARDDAACVVLQRERAPAKVNPQREHDWRVLWEEAVNYAKTSDCVPLAAGHPLCILPDGAASDHGGSMVALAVSMESRLQAGAADVRIADVATPAAQSAIYGTLLCGRAVELVEGNPSGSAVPLSWSMPRSLNEPPGSV